MRSRMAPQDEGVNTLASPPLSTPPLSSRPERSGEPGSPSGEDGTCRAEIPGQARDDGEMVEAGEMVGAGTRGENSPTPHPEEQTRLGLRLEGRGLAGPDGPACWNPSSFETRCEAASLLRMRGRGLILSTPPPSSRPQRSGEPGSQPNQYRITIPSS